RFHIHRLDLLVFLFKQPDTVSFIWHSVNNNRVRKLNMILVFPPTVLFVICQPLAVSMLVSPTTLQKKQRSVNDIIHILKLLPPPAVQADEKNLRFIMLTFCNK